MILTDSPSSGRCANVIPPNVIPPTAITTPVTSNSKVRLIFCLLVFADGHLVVVAPCCSASRTLEKTVLWLAANFCPLQSTIRFEDQLVAAICGVWSQVAQIADHKGGLQFSVHD